VVGLGHTYAVEAAVLCSPTQIFLSAESCGRLAEGRGKFM